MQQFKIAPDKLSGFKIALARRAVTMALLMMGCCLSGCYWALSANLTDDNIQFFPVSSFLAVLIFGVIVSRKIKKTRKIAETYILTIDNHSIMREQAGMPTVSIVKNKIKRIYRTKNGNLLVIGPRLKEYIDIPPQIDNYPQLYDMLNNIKPVKRLSYNNGLFFLIAGIPLGLSAFGIIAVTNKMVIAICSAIICGVIIFCIYMILSGKYGDEKTKKNIWLYIAAVIFYIAVTISKFLE